MRTSDSRLFAALLALGVFSGCATPEPRTASASADPQQSISMHSSTMGGRAHPSLPCFAAESLAARPLFFGEIAVSDESGDYSGLELRFELADSMLVAKFRDAAGGLPPAVAVDSLAYDADRDSMTIRNTLYGTSRNLYTFRPACDQLTGTARLFMTDASPVGQVMPFSLPRLLNPLPDNP